MKVNLEKLNKKHWFEDENGNEIEIGDGVCGSDSINKKFQNGEIIYYKRCFPLELHQFTDEFCYHPKNPIIKFLCRKSRGEEKSSSRSHRGGEEDVNREA